ncbi:5006_t:CDS:2 [Rhizophagus irregularis]|nr:5006_t:CDS:2 [Rhizophagus irregularis]
MILIILLQFIHEVNTQAPADVPGPPPEGAVPSPAKAPPGGLLQLLEGYSKAIATPGNENNNNISNPGIMNDDLYHNKMLPIPIELVIPNQGQELAPNYNNQQGATRELGNNSVDNETIQNIRQEMVHNLINTQAPADVPGPPPEGAVPSPAKAPPGGLGYATF